MSPRLQSICRQAVATLAAVAAGGLAMYAFAATPVAPVWKPTPVSPDLEKDFLKKGYKLDAQSGNYLHPRLSAKTFHEPLAPLQIDGRYVRDVRGQPIFLRQSLRDKLELADLEMFKKKHAHIQIVYGFRPNYVQVDLFNKLNGHGKVAPAGMSYHETGMAVDLQNWRDAQGFMIEAGFVGGCYGMEEDMVHYSVGELTKASFPEEFKRCTLKEIPKDMEKDAVKVGKGAEKVGDIITFGHLPGVKKPSQ